MRKQVYKNLFKAMLLPVIAMLTVLLISLGTMALEARSTTYSLVLNFSENVDSYTVEIVHPSTGETVTNTIKDTDKNGTETIDIVYDSRVTVTINPATGYWPESATCTGGDNSPALQGNTMIWSSYDATYTLNVVCAEREYKVVAENIDGSTVPPLLYDIDDDDWTLGINALYDGTLTYKKGRTPLTELPVVKLQNHTFKGWNIVVGSTTIPITVSADGKYYIPADLTILKSFDDDGGQITVRPVLEPVTYDVYRQDHIYDPSVSGNQGSLLLKPPMSATVAAGTLISAIQLDSADWYSWDDDKNGYREYAGYYLVTDVSKYAPHRVSKPTESNEKYNTVIRFYLPITYTLVYLDSDGETLLNYSAPGEYVYGHATSINTPTRAGYTFAGWTVMVYKDGAWQTVTAMTGADFAFGDESSVTFTESGNRVDPNAIYASDAQDNGSYEIRLVANWTPNRYTITYDWNVPSELAALLEETNATLINDYGSFVFESGDMILPAPTRCGYHFIGWSLTYVDGVGQTITLTSEDLAEMLDPETCAFTLKTQNYPSDITLTAQWQAKEYTVILDPADGVAGTTARLDTAVKYDQQLTISETLRAEILPTRLGYTFLGFFSEDGTKYINADGCAVADQPWKVDDADGSGTVTLYAHWEVNYYDISIDLTGVSDADVLADVRITIFPAGREPVILSIGQVYAIEFGTTFTVQIQMPNGYKVVWWSESGSVAHKTLYTVDVTVDSVWDGTKSLVAKALPVQTFDATVEANVDYRNEVIRGLTNGNYVIRIDGIDGTLTYSVTAGTLVIDNAWFGRRIELVYCGDGETTSDSEPCALELAARPKRPELNTTQNPSGEIDQIRARDDKIDIILENGFTGLFEFAIRIKDSDTPLVWQSTGTFDSDIQAGTWYEIYIRRAATDTAPHGEAFLSESITTHSGYVADKKAELDALLDENSGPLAKQLIEDKKAEIDDLAAKDQLDDDFYEQVEAIVESVRTGELALANKKDATLALLASVLAGCRNERFYYTEENADAMDELYANAVNAITLASNDATVEAVYNEAKRAMEAIPLRALADANGQILLESLLGIDQESALTLIRNSDFEELSRAISEAIRTSGKVAVNGFITSKEAEELLRALDVVAYYKLDMIGSERIKTGDTFKITLQLPQNLRSMTGLQVAYYNADTGVIELLETEVSADGKTLTFYADRVADFVILADPTVNLVGVIIALSGVLLLQVVALAFILVSRSKNKKNVMHASVALPIAFLTIHFAPVNGEIIALVLGAAVIAMQIALTILLLKSDMIWRSRRKSDASDGGDGYGEVGAYAVPAQSDAMADAEDNISSDESQLADAVADGTEEAAAEDETDPFAIYEDDEILEEETENDDFIDPAPETRYSLADEPFAEQDTDALNTEDDTVENADDEAPSAYDNGGEQLYDDFGALYEDDPDALYEEVYGEAGELYEENPDALYEEILGESVAADEADALNDAETDESVDGDAVIEEPYFFDDAEPLSEELSDSDDTDPMYHYDE